MTNIEKAYFLYCSEKYKEAFNLYKQIASDEQNSPIDRSEAYNMLGLIGGNINKDLLDDEKDEFEFYNKAMELDSADLMPVINLISAYGIGYNFHTNHGYFINAYNAICNFFLNELSEEQKNIVAERKQLYDKLNQKIK